MWGQLASMGVQLAGAVLGAVRSARENKKAQQELDKKEAREEARYARRYNESTLDRADMQRLITETGRRLREDNQRVEGQQAVMGGGEEAAAAQKEANANAMGNTMAGVAAEAELDKRKEEDRHQRAMDDISDQRAELHRQKGQMITKAAEQVMGSVAGAAAGMDGAMQKGAKPAPLDMNEQQQRLEHVTLPAQKKLQNDMNQVKSTLQDDVDSRKNQFMQKNFPYLYPSVKIK